jgi:membrane protein implicated in regulation of membrane protease activity
VGSLVAGVLPGAAFPIAGGLLLVAAVVAATVARRAAPRRPVLRPDPAAATAR